ncbi:membrane protein [Tritrichomonas foetus]|uniref:Membrane protein n=1 Tax=Tritrichomonas foetus TaxID=1144522 RepID=A0A1J4KF79_9EUKA|nr:membrane protein [Tritrichomonas foetus]|eukprot:OHT08254.1 membrane protein [Tritrichomonas foetus]
MGFFNNAITRLCDKSYFALNVIAFISAFACYFSMYAYRKTFTAASYSGIQLWHVDFKIMAITFQVIGYTISKFYGIKFISELSPRLRGLWIIIFITIAEISLIIFGAVPAPYSALVMFINGLPLGMIWGLVFSYLEGRQTSEVLGSGMAISFIISSGAVKSVGSQLMKMGVSQFWMSAAVGAIFYPVMLISVFFLESLPDPNEKDILSRTERVSMTAKDRKKFCKIFGPGVVVMTIFYMFLTAYRDFRDNFAPELWQAFGYSDTPSIYTTSEIIVAVVVVIPIGLFMLIKEHIHTFIAYHTLICFGQILLEICAIITGQGKMAGLYFMIISGVGLYVGYVPFNSIIFDLFIATFKYKANSGFLMYICDSFGYLSSVVILFVKNFASPDLSWFNFFLFISYAMAGIGIITIVLSLIYYLYKYKTWKPVEESSKDVRKNEDEADETRTDDDDETKSFNDQEDVYESQSSTSMSDSSTSDTQETV